MSSAARVWVNLATSFILALAPYLLDKLQNDYPVDPRAWTLFVIGLAAQAAGVVRAWMTNTPEQARVVQDLRDAGLSAVVSKSDPTVLSKPGEKP